MPHTNRRYALPIQRIHTARPSPIPVQPPGGCSATDGPNGHTPFTTLQTMAIRCDHPRGFALRIAPGPEQLTAGVFTVPRNVLKSSMTTTVQRPGPSHCSPAACQCTREEERVKRRAGIVGSEASDVHCIVYTPAPTSIIALNCLDVLSRRNSPWTACRGPNTVDSTLPYRTQRSGVIHRPSPVVQSLGRAERKLRPAQPLTPRFAFTPPRGPARRLGRPSSVTPTRDPARPQRTARARPARWYPPTAPSSDPQRGAAQLAPVCPRAGECIARPSGPWQPFPAARQGGWARAST
ncbi:hypothetical protein GY45DRAFT_1334523 [Cubamyces sp. BRFM 1775]|nr:hypothetical protein GY45DRAFT_1334523 [Cubamyces sp. BRFM 1775]